MSKKLTTLSVLAFLVAVAALVVAGLAWFQAWKNQPLDEVKPVAPVAIADIAGVRAEPGDVTFDLSSLDAGGNTQVIWHCGKVLAGVRSDYAAAWTDLQGKLLVSGTSHALRAGEIHLAVGAMRGHGGHPAPNALINTVRSDRWFLEQEHPLAVFRGTALSARRDGEQAALAEAVAGWTHHLSGTLALNGVEQALLVPARVEVAEGSVRIDTVFPISRKAFGIERRQGFEPPADVDDRVLIEVHIHATRDPLSVVAELNGQLVAQQAATGELSDRVANLTARLEQIEGAIDELRRSIERGVAATPSIDIAALPPRFVDHVDYRNSDHDPRFKDIGYAPEFTMVLMPGDPAAGIAPFYAQTTEVTWEMFRAWSYCEDVADDTKIAAMRAADLRPSPCYDDASRGFGFDGRAALGLSRRNALAFCRYLSERTGRSYRLMTGAEWTWIAKATGGVPAVAQEVAWLRNNADTDLFGEPMPMPVAQKPADKFGLFDFWGNVAEWVMDDKQYIRGGSYLTEAKDLTLEWREDESQDVWNATYPNRPKSKWWYRDRFDMGFRLCCDPVNLPRGK
ncbi:MAG: SUMF1/EgtB/PvdO family nonheme iron enzyme [Planctomycetota bacterium]